MTEKVTNPKHHQFVICIRNDEFPASLERAKVYQVLSDDQTEREELVRIVDESGEDYLYPRDFFVEIDLPESARKAIVA